MPKKLKSFKLSDEIVRRVIETVDAGLTSGLGHNKPGEMCVEAAVCYALGLPHGDDPQCVDPVIRTIKISLNDSEWSSQQARADGLRRLAVLQLGTKEPAFDNRAFIKRAALMVINTVLPIALLAAGFPQHAECCAVAKTLEEGVAASDAARVASYAASDAARAASYAARAASHAARAASYAASDKVSDAARVASYAASDAAIAASYAASYAASDKVLKTFAVGIENILIEMKVPAVKYLGLLDDKNKG